MRIEIALQGQNPDSHLGRRSLVIGRSQVRSDFILMDYQCGAATAMGRQRRIGSTYHDRMYVHYLDSRKRLLGVGDVFGCDVDAVKRVPEVVHDVHLLIPRGRDEAHVTEQVNGSNLAVFVGGVEFLDCQQFSNEFVVAWACAG